jgi:hypothetical protein
MSDIGWIVGIVFVAAIIIWFVVATWRHYSGIWRRMSSEYQRQAQRHKGKP